MASKKSAKKSSKKGGSKKSAKKGGSKKSAKKYSAKSGAKKSAGKGGAKKGGAKKGGASDTFQILHKSPGLEDLWQLHYAVDAKDLNSRDQLIANPDETTAYSIKVTARADGSFTVTNSRNGYHKDYGPRS